LRAGLSGDDVAGFGSGDWWCGERAGGL